MTVYTVESPKPVHRSFRLTRPSDGVAVQSQIRPALVLPEREARVLLAAAGRQDVSRGGVFSAGPAGVQVWSGEWDGPGGSHGTAAHLGSVDWSYDTPARHYITVYRVLVTPAGTAAGLTTESVLSRVLGLAGLTADGSTLAMNVPPPRDPFRSAELRERAQVESQFL
ncbi:MAG: hypothetical protein LC789_13965 [Actinobacteria bacterium]|nr:hypothetical protein [Actinomycetota bacterium]MCA1720784.1 hypothetical protein [Actinomycetota bacterium]